MYHEIWKDYRADFLKRNPRFPREKSYSIGRALWAISREKGIKFIEISRRTGIPEGPLLAMSSSHKLTSSPKRIQSLAEALGVSTEDFLKIAREEFYGNFFITKARMPSEKEIRQYARRGLYLHEQSVLAYPDSKSPDFRVICHTPPVESLVDFFSATVQISPGKAIKDCRLPRPIRVHLAVMSGAVQIQDEADESVGELLAGQTAVLNGNIIHSIRNLSDKRDSEILITIRPTQVLAKQTPAFFPKTSKSAWDISALIDQIRRHLSPDPRNPIPLREVALLAGMSPWSLDNLSKGESLNLPIAKLERLAEIVEVPLEDLSHGLPFAKGLDLQITKGDERGMCDYRAYFGVTFYPWSKLRTGKRELFMGKVGFEPPFSESKPAEPQQSKLELKERIWRGKSWGYLMAKGLGGQVEAHLGMRHTYSEIEQEDTIYLDMSLGYTFRNFSAAEQTNLFLVSSASLP